MRYALIILFTVFAYGLNAQAFREIYTQNIILNENTDNNNNLFIVRAPTLTQSVTFTIPVGEGVNGDILTTNGINSTTWSGLDFGAVGGSGNGLIQYNDDGFGGSSSFIWDNTNGYLGVGLTSPSYTLHTSGTISVGSTSNPAVLAIGSNNGSGNYLYVKTNASSNSTINFTLPANNGTANQGLLTNSSGSLSWGGEIKKGPVSNNEPDDNDISSNADNAYIGGGNDNDINNSADNSTIYGGEDNDINNNANSSIIIGGHDGDINNSANYSTIFGGEDNDINNNTESAIMVGGSNNDLNNDSHYSFIGAGNDNDFNNTSQSSVIFAGSNNDFNNNSSYSIIGAGDDNDHNGNYGGILAGEKNDNESNDALRSVIFSGEENSNDDNDSFIGSGYKCILDTEFSVILSGYENEMNNSAHYNTILYGRKVDISNSSNYAAVGGRDVNVDNTSSYSVMFGRKLKNSGNTGVFLFGDSNDSELDAGGNNRFRARFSGGYRFWTNAASNVGVGMDANANAWSSVSDRNLKEAIISLNPTEFLNKIKKLDIFSWSYIGFEDDGIRNYGPMAQDFYTLFGNDEYGTYGDDKSIKELDAAAIFILGVQGSKTEVDNQTELVEIAVENSDEIDLKIRELERKLELLEKEINK